MHKKTLKIIWQVNDPEKVLHFKYLVLNLIIPLWWQRFLKIKIFLYWNTKKHKRILWMDQYKNSPKLHKEYSLSVKKTQFSVKVILKLTKYN